jgi:hypothetical protein
MRRERASGRELLSGVDALKRRLAGFHGGLTFVIVATTIVDTGVPSTHPPMFSS